MNDNIAATEAFLDTLPKETLWELFRETGKIQYYIRYSKNK